MVWLDPACLAVHPRNVRDDLGDPSGPAASNAAQGGRSPGVPSGCRAPARRRRHPRRVQAVPCVVRPDLSADATAADGDRATQAGHVAAMLAENLHRQGLSAVEEARGVQAMLDLGVTLNTVARSTGLGRKRVAKAAGVARPDNGTAAAVSKAGLTLGQAAAVAVYADGPDTMAVSIEAAGEGPGQFAHALTRAMRVREEAQQVAARSAELAAAGRLLLDEAAGSQHARISSLAHDGQPLTAEVHAT